jgi:hypothetical protein
VKATFDVGEAKGYSLDALFFFQVVNVVLLKLAVGGSLGYSTLSLQVKLFKLVIWNF